MHQNAHSFQVHIGLVRIDHRWGHKKFKKIELLTATGKRQNLAFKLDRLVLYTLDKKHIFENVTVCISHVSFDGYSIILHPDLIKEDYKHENVMDTEKVG